MAVDKMMGADNGIRSGSQKDPVVRQATKDNGARVSFQFKPDELKTLDTFIKKTEEDFQIRMSRPQAARALCLRMLRKMDSVL